MAGEDTKRRRFLFLDDDAAFLAMIRELFSGMSQGRWGIFTAENHAQALLVLQRQ